MKILLINPPMPERTYPGKAMGLDYIAAQLIENNDTVEIIDLDITGRNGLRPCLSRFRPKIVGLTNLSIQNDVANDIAREVKNYDSSIITVKGGYHELFGYEVTLTYHHGYVDYVVVGEGEKTFLDLVRTLEKGSLARDRSRILGLAYFNDRVIFNGKRPLLNETELNDCIPSRLIFHRSYNFDIFDGRKTAQVMTSRGCMDTCFFCTESRLSRVDRKRSLESIYTELQELAGDGYEAIYFDDSTFTRDQRRTISICNMFEESFPEFVWGCNTRVDCLNNELISMMGNSRCAYMFTGVESIVPEVLLGMNKTQNPGKYVLDAENVYARLYGSSIKSSVFLLFGAPRRTRTSDGVTYSPETFQDVKKSIDISLYRLKPRYLSMNVLRLLPGAPYSISEKFGCLWPDGTNVHAGYYDRMWYDQEAKMDLRATHHIYRAFEARRCIVPPYMTPDYCYDILRYTVDAINRINNKNHYQCKIVVAKQFEESYIVCKDGKYMLAPLSEMADDL